MRLLYNRVAVHEIKVEGENVTPSGIALVEGSKPKENKGTVVAIGDGSFTANGNKLPMTVKVGDTVLFERTQAVESVMEGEKVLIMGEASIIAILD